jgi:DNA-binding beta-propeller fold protein YncE
MKGVAKLVLLAVIIGPGLHGCGSSGSGTTGGTGTNLVPGIDFLSPSGVAVGGPAFTLSVSGPNFVADSAVRWNGNDRPTAFVSSHRITAQIPASDLAATGTAAITVFNPEPGAGSSTAVTFTIATGGVHPSSVVVDPTGRFAYVANAGSNNVSMYSIDGATGVLTLIGTIGT